LIGAVARLAGQKCDSKSLKFVLAALFVALTAAAIYEPNLFSPNRYDFAALVIRFGTCVLIAYLLFFAKWPVPGYFRWVTAIAPFSYSLYITHAPLLIFGLSLSQNWIQYSYLRSAIAMLASAALAMAICMLLAKIFEQTRYYKDILMDACLRNEAA
jgi:peptidoglycan/LPS O-acetylase OafA/YrhL